MFTWQNSDEQNSCFNWVSIVPTLHCLWKLQYDDVQHEILSDLEHAALHELTGARGFV